MSIWKDAKRGLWRYEFQHLGIRYASKGYRSKSEAKAAMAEAKSALKKELQQTRHAMSYREAASVYLDWAEKRFARQTYKYKKYVLKRFHKYLKVDILIDQILPHHIHSYLKKQPSNNLYNVHRKELSTMFNYLRRTLKLNINNPCADIDKLPHTPTIKEIPTQDDIMKLKLAARPGDEADNFLCCLLTLGRIDEILRLAWQDINFERRTIRLWTRKRKSGAYEADTLPMNEDLYEMLIRRYKARKSEKWVFYNHKTNDRFYHRPKMMASLCQRAKVPHYGFHALRHFMASHLVDREKVSKKAISDLLRHKSLQTTEIYLHSVDESMRQAMTQIEGFFTKPHTGATHIENTKAGKAGRGGRI